MALLLLKILCCRVKLSLCLCECTRRRKLRTPVEEIEQNLAIGRAFRPQIRLAQEVGEDEVEQIECDDERYAPRAERRECRTGHRGENAGGQRLRNGTQVEVTQGFAARQEIVQKLTLARVARTQRNRCGRAAIGCLLQVLIARECKPMGEQAVEIAKDGTPDTACAH